MEHRVRLGWWLSSEEHDPRDLVAHAVQAEAAGLTTAMISDHLQPWTRRQGSSPHVWSVLGAIAHATESLELGTGVTALVHRNDPINVAQASATVAVMSQGRFFLGVGTGERLNEQPFGERWPASAERRERLGEAIDVIKDLWSGRTVNHRGRHWAVEGLELFTRPATAPPLYVATGGTRSATLAGTRADGIIGVSPDRKVIEVFRGTGGRGKPCLAQLHVSIASSVDRAREQAWEWWPNGVVPPPLLGEVARPAHFEAAAGAAGPASIADSVVCAVDAGPIIRAIDRFVGAGFDTVYLHQVGPHQERLAQVCTKELLPHYAPSRS